MQQQPLTPTQERTLGSIAHGAPLVAMVLSAGLLGFVGSLVIYLMYRDRGPFVRAHAANSLNVQIITGIVLLISLSLMLVLIGFGHLPVLGAGLRLRPAPPRRGQGAQRRVVEPADDAQVREVTLT